MRVQRAPLSIEPRTSLLVKGPIQPLGLTVDYGFQPTGPLLGCIPGEAPCQSHPQATMIMAFSQQIPRLLQ